MKAFHNNIAIKEKYLNRVDAHRKADEIVQGLYWENGKGCAVGCTVETSETPHQVMENELGIPKELAYLEDVIFEELKNGVAKDWPGRFLNAIKPGADLSLVVPKFIIWQFEDPKNGLIKTDAEALQDPELMKVCTDLVDLYKQIITGNMVSDKEFEKIYERAGTRAWAWAGAGTRAWAWAGAGAGAWAWAGAGAGAGAGTRAWARAWAWAGADYDKAVILMADKLIELLEQTGD